MRVLVTGANGQVGHELLRALARDDAAVGARHARDPGAADRAVAGARDARDRSIAGMARSHEEQPVGEVIGATRSGALEDGTPCERIDLADPGGLAHALDRIAPDLVINAAAYTAVDRAEDEPELAQRINGDAPGALGAWAARHGARVIHYSTDYVFDGTATRPYREDDATHPASAYGRSKLAGELALRESGAPHLVFRTAWVYAARGHNFLLTMLRLGAERDALRVVDDQVGAPTPARMIADVTAQAVARWGSDDTDVPGGVYHLVAAGQASWCGFARAIFERAHRAGLLARMPDVQAIRTADYPTKAARPPWSVLDTAKLRNAFGIALPDWHTALDGVVDELAAGTSRVSQAPGGNLE